MVSTISQQMCMVHGVVTLDQNGECPACVQALQARLKIRAALAPRGGCECADPTHRAMHAPGVLGGSGLEGA